MPRPPPDPLYTLKSDGNPVHSICFCAKSKNEKLFSGCQSGQVQLWSLKSNRNVEGLQAHCGPCINVSCHGPNLITQGKGDGHVKSWHTLEGGGWAPNYTIYTKHSIFCRFSRLGGDDDATSMLICPDEDYSVAAYSTETGEKITDLNMKDLNAKSKELGFIMALKSFYEPSSRRPMFLAAHEGGQISLRDLSAAGQEICKLNVNQPIISLEYDPIQGVGIYGSPENTYVQKFLIDTKTGTAELGSRTAITNPGISCIQFRPDTKVLATGGWDGRLRFFHWQQSHQKYHHDDQVNASSCNLEEKSVNSDTGDTKNESPMLETIDNASISGTNDATAETTTVVPSENVPSYKKVMKQLAVLRYHSKSIQCIAFSEGYVEPWDCSCLFAAASDDGGISLWDLYNESSDLF